MYTRCPPPLSLAVEVDNTQRSRAHVATGHPAAINLVRPNGQSSDATDRCQTGNRKKVVYEAERKKMLTGGESVCLIIIISRPI